MPKKIFLNISQGISLTYEVLSCSCKEDISIFEELIKVVNYKVLERNLINIKSGKLSIEGR